MSAKHNHRRRNRARNGYSGSKAVDSSCRNHGKCVWCRMGREHLVKRQAPIGGDA